MSDSAIRKSASRMGLATLCSRVLGLMREQVFANLFGASLAADAFNIAFRIPNLLRDLFAEGAMSAAFVPEFTKTTMSSREKAFRLLAGVLWMLAIIVGTLSFIGIVFSEELAGLFASSFKTVPGKFELVVGLTRVMFPFFPLVAMAAVLMGALNSMGFFFLPAFAPVLFNVASILCGFFLCPWIGAHTSYPPIYGMGIGVVVGGFLQFYVQWLQARRNGFRWKTIFQMALRPLSEPGVKKVLLLLIPGTVGLAATQLGILINSIYATTAGPGAVSWLNYAFRLMQFPIGVFGVSIAAATLPQISRGIAVSDSPAISRSLRRSLLLCFAINLPAAAGLMAIGLPLVQMLFEHGKFRIEDSLETSRAVFYYALGLPSYSVVKILVPIFYAVNRARIPVVMSFIMVSLNLILNHLFIEVYQYPFWSLALVTSICAIVNSMCLCVWLVLSFPQHFKETFNFNFFKGFFLHLLISLVVGCGAFGVTYLVSNRIPSSFKAWITQVGMALFVSILIWFLLGKVFGLQEIEETFEIFSRKLRAKRKKIG